MASLGEGLPSAEGINSATALGSFHLPYHDTPSNPPETPSTFSMKALPSFAEIGCNGKDFFHTFNYQLKTLLDFL